jgi:hypothetical protein
MNDKSAPRRAHRNWTGASKNTVADRSGSALDSARPNDYGGSRSRWKNSESLWAAPAKDGLSPQARGRRQSWDRHVSHLLRDGVGRSACKRYRLNAWIRIALVLAPGPMNP